MTNDQAKLIFNYYKIEVGNFIGRKSIFISYCLFEKAEVLCVEYIGRVKYWDKTKKRYMCRATYNTTEFNRLQLEDFNKKQDENSKQLTLF